MGPGEQYASSEMRDDLETSWLLQRHEQGFPR